MKHGNRFTSYSYLIIGKWFVVDDDSLTIRLKKVIIYGTLEWDNTLTAAGYGKVFDFSAENFVVLGKIGPELEGDKYGYERRGFSISSRNFYIACITNSNWL